MSNELTPTEIENIRKAIGSSDSDLQIALSQKANCTTVHELRERVNRLETRIATLECSCQRK